MRIIAGTARSRTILAPKGSDTRPTLDRVRENLFNILGTEVRDAAVLDLFAGSGALALEALSRGARRAVLVDRDRSAHAVERQNVLSLGFSDRCRILLCDWKQALRKLTEEGTGFDLVFLDPPYAMEDLRQLSQLLLPLTGADSLLVTEHQAGRPYLLADSWQLCDSRKYGYVGLSMYRRSEEAEPT